MRLGEQKHCMDGYRRILSLLPLEEGEHFMQLSKDMAKYRTHTDTRTRHVSWLLRRHHVLLVSVLQELL